MSAAVTTDYHIINVLNQEWAGLADGHRGTVAAWAERHPALSGCGDLGSVLAAVRGRPDDVLGALLAEVASGDTVAGRTVLQAMLGKLVRMAQRDRLGGVDDYVAAMWCRIDRYPLDRRPSRIAANLALDTLKDVLAERRANTAQLVTPWPPERFTAARLRSETSGRRLGEAAQIADLGVTEVVTAARRLGLIDPPTGAVLLSVYRDGLTSRQAGERHRTSSEMVRYRCSQAVRKLAQHSAALAEAA